MATTIRVDLSGEHGPVADSAAATPGPATSVDRSYDITIGSAILASCGHHLQQAAARRAVVIADAAVEELHAGTVVTSLQTAGIQTTLLVVPRGEASKSIAEAGRLWQALAGAAVDRSTHLVAVGGGVVGDLAGFVAATFARGLPVWQVPTTLVAQVDSAIGGKTGINLPAGKNLVGAFWQPRGVIADIATLATLPEREFVSGLAEVVKYGMILDAQFFGWLEANAAAILRREPAPLEHVVARSAALKAWVVERDEMERAGLRVVLNYGHTFAHALETAAGYGTLLHGEAVAIGMAAAADLAARMGLIGAEIPARQDALLTTLGLPVRTGSLPLPPAENLIDIMARDKKTLHGRLRFVLPRRIGHVELIDGVEPILVQQVLDR